jgi:hypothetical protein
MLHRTTLGALGCLALPAALVAAWWLWKRDVSFTRDHWRFAWHIADTGLDRFPFLAPAAPPIYRQWISSGLTSWIEVRYDSLAPFADVMRTIAALCPNEPWTRLDPAALAAEADRAAALGCGKLLVSLSPAAAGLHVHAFRFE